jgi:branched-chain amino acid transport system substrate-binding protein
MKRSRFLCLALCVIALSAGIAMTPLAASAQSKAAEAKTLEIGMLLSVTGFFSSREVPDYNETLIAADMINEKGGINVGGQKYKVKLLLEDCKSTMDGVTAAANRLVHEKKVKFILGPTAFFAAAAGPVVDPAKVLRVLTYSVNTPGECDATTPYAFLGANATMANVIATAKYLKKAYPKVKKIVLVHPDDGAVPVLFPIMKGLMEANGFTVLGEMVRYPNEMQDFSPIASKINSYKDADAAVQLNGIGPHVGGIVKGLRQLGNKKPYAAAIPTSLSEVVTIAGKEATKDVYTHAISYDEPALPPIAKEICKRTVAKHGKDYSLYLTGADALYDLKYVIEAAKSLDPTAVKTKWESLSKIDTIFGPGVVCGEKTFGIKNHVVAHAQSIQILKDGKVVPGGIVDVGVIP